MHWLWVIIIGFLAGAIAKLFIHGPGGFIVTTLLGIAGAIFASWLGQRIGWYPPGRSAGRIGRKVRRTKGQLATPRRCRPSRMR